MSGPDDIADPESPGETEGNNSALRGNPANPWCGNSRQIAWKSTMMTLLYTLDVIILHLR